MFEDDLTPIKADLPKRLKILASIDIRHPLPVEEGVPRGEVDDGELPGGEEHSGEGRVPPVDHQADHRVLAGAALAPLHQLLLPRALPALAAKLELVLHLRPGVEQVRHR